MNQISDVKIPQLEGANHEEKKEKDPGSKPSAGAKKRMRLARRKQMFPDGAEILPVKNHIDNLLDVYNQSLIEQDEFLNSFMVPVKPANGVNTRHYNLIVKQVLNMMKDSIDISTVVKDLSDPFWEKQYSKLARCKNNDPALTDKENFLNSLILLLDRKIGKLLDMHCLALPCSHEDRVKNRRGIHTFFELRIYLATTYNSSAGVVIILSDTTTANMNFTISKDGDKVNMTIGAGCITSRPFSYPIIEMQNVSLIKHLWNSMVGIFGMSDRQTQPGYDE
jgi:hypothetical protein